MHEKILPGEMRILDTGIKGYEIVLTATHKEVVANVVLPSRMVNQYVEEMEQLLQTDCKDVEIDLVQIAVAFYASLLDEDNTPRGVFFREKDTHLRNLKTLRNVLDQKWGQTVNNQFDLEAVFNRLNTGPVKEDPFGALRGQSVRSLIHALTGVKEEPVVYFDRMRRFPAYSSELIELLNLLDLNNRDWVPFDEELYQRLATRFDDAVTFVSRGNGNSFDQNPDWQAYAQKWGDWRKGLRF